MKPIDEIKINQLLGKTLFAKEMNSLRGGKYCSCSCYWANQGGSSSEANRNANYNIGENGGYSVQGCNQYSYNDTSGELTCPPCNEDNW